jgi:hypothetical protein
MSMFYSVVFIHIVRILYRVLGAQQSYSSNEPSLSVFFLADRFHREGRTLEIDLKDGYLGIAPCTVCSETPP